MNLKIIINILESIITILGSTLNLHIIIVTTLLSFYSKEIMMVILLQTFTSDSIISQFISIRTITFIPSMKFHTELRTVVNTSNTLFNIWMTQLVNATHLLCDTVHTNTCVIINVQLKTTLAGTLIGSINVITYLCTSTIISQAFINIYNNNIQLQLQMTTRCSAELGLTIIIA